MTELNIKFVFLGNKKTKEPKLINNTLCIPLNSSKSFLFANSNKNLFKYLLNSNNPKNTIALLQSYKFYDFISKISNINNYTKILEYHKLNNFNYSEKLIKHFKKGDILAAEKLIKGEITKNYFNILKEKYPQMVIQKNTKEKKPKRPIIRKSKVK